MSDFISFFRTILFNVLNPYTQWLNKREFKRQPYSLNERPVEYGFVFRHISKLYPSEVLDVGTGTTALPHLMYNCGLRVTAIDNIKNYWRFGMYNRHYYVINDDITQTMLNKQFDLVTCISVLEHIESFDIAVRNMFRLLKPGGHLILTSPYTENRYIDNVYTLPGSSAQGKIVEQEYWQFWDGDYWSVGNKIIPPRQTKANKKHQLSCILFQKQK